MIEGWGLLLCIEGPLCGRERCVATHPTAPDGAFRGTTIPGVGACMAGIALYLACIEC